MTTTHFTTFEDVAALELEDTPLEDWAPVVLDPVRERLVQLGGERIAEALAEAAPSPFLPLSTTYGWFSRICGETDEALVAWFQPVGDVPAVRLVVADPFASGWAMTEELAVPSLRRHLVVLGGWCEANVPAGSDELEACMSTSWWVVDSRGRAADASFQCRWRADGVAPLRRGPRCPFSSEPPPTRWRSSELRARPGGQGSRPRPTA